MKTEDVIEQRRSARMGKSQADAARPRWASPYHSVQNSRYNVYYFTEALAMGNQLELLEAEALKLTAGERAAFAQLLLASLDEDTEIEEAWAAETERRIADIESGATQTIPIAEALAQVRAALK